MDFILYLLVITAYRLIKLEPHWLIKFNARWIGLIIYLWPISGRLAKANVRAAFPDKTKAEVNRIAYLSFYNLTLNFSEFMWMCGNKKRIERYTIIPEPTLSLLKECVAKNERIIFVNPHLGSWEASGLMAPHYAGVKMVAIAKPVRNKYLNNFLNKLGREQEEGLQIVQSKGAMRACIKALKAGQGVGTLIDQNTRVRDGGVFVDFFGMTVPSSTSPAVLLEYCRKNDIPAKIIYGTSVRLENGIITAHSELLSKPFEEYESDKEVLQELMNISESYIRKYPEHYLWLYRRFQYIEPEMSEEQRKRYPFYATVASPRFYRKIRVKK